MLTCLSNVSELRGGAWVVLDPAINAHKIQMFADPNARGGTPLATPSLT